MNKRVGKLVLVMIILFFGFLSFQRYTGFVAYSDNITIPETFIQNLDVENVKLYDTNNNGLVDVIEPGKLAKVKIKDTEKQRIIISFNDGSISVMELTEDDINELLKNTNIKSLSLDYKFNLTLQDTIPLINASLVYSIVITNNITGSDSVCILDSGIYSRHAAFKDRIIAKKCYADDDYIGNNNGYCANNTEESDSAEDDLGHGTLVAGIVGASDGITGVAPSSKLVIVKVCNYMGQCQYSDLIKGINYCINNKNNYNNCYNPNPRNAMKHGFWFAFRCAGSNSSFFRSTTYQSYITRLNLIIKFISRITAHSLWARSIWFITIIPYF
ncbi:MAG: S8 family serine peptidase, partial [Nanoarchaeota archaeon]|nr:S8 family serine peptidase [Nanoarchaeota archaeon]